MLSIQAETKRIMGAFHTPRFMATVLGILILITAGASGQTPDTAEETAADETAATGLSARYAARETGLRALSDGLNEAAARFFEKYRALTNREQPDFADATILLATAYYREGLVERADEALAEYMKTRPAPVEDDYYQEGLTYWKARILFAQGKPQDAVKTLQPVARTALTPSYRAQMLALLGDAHVQLKQWSQAEQVFDTYLEQFAAGDQVLHVRMGQAQVYLATEQYERAAAVLDTIGERYGDAATPRVTLYRILLSSAQGKLDVALDLYQSIRDKRPQTSDKDWWTALSTLVSRLFEAGQHERVVELAPQAEVLAPETRGKIQMRMRQAESQISLERQGPAIETLESFKRDFPDVPQTVQVEFKLAELLRKSGNYELASEYFDNVASNPDAAASLRYRAGIERGWTLLDAEQYNDAVQAFSKTAKLGQTDSEKANAYFLAGEAAYRMGNYTGAAMLYQTVADQYGESEHAENARFKQAKSRAGAKLYLDAALVYAQFLEEFPQSVKRQQANLERGIALKNSGSFEEAMQVLDNFVKSYPDSEHAPRALLEAYAAAKASGALAETIDFLTRLINGYPESELFPHALYQRTHVHFLHGHFAAGLTDSKRFLEEFPKLPMAADVLMWVGDYYANTGDFPASENHYMRVVSEHPQLPQAQTALYEAARSSHKRGDAERAKVLMRQLFERYAQDPEPAIIARAHILFGDILSEEGSYGPALEHFTTAADQSPDSELKLSAKGRVADMSYSSATKNTADPEEAEKQLQKAVAIYSELAENDGASQAFRESARYRLAKAQEKLGRIDAAIDEYLEIVYRYDMDLKRGKVRDWYYFARSGYDVARLLVASEDYEDAARVYERLYEAGIPTAEDARQRARQIREGQTVARENGP